MNAFQIAGSGGIACDIASSQPQSGTERLQSYENTGMLGPVRGGSAPGNRVLPGVFSGEGTCPVTIWRMFSRMNSQNFFGGPVIPILDCSVALWIVAVARIIGGRPILAFTNWSPWLFAGPLLAHLQKEFPIPGELEDL